MSFENVRSIQPTRREIIKGLVAGALTLGLGCSSHRSRRLATTKRTTGSWGKRSVRVAGARGLATTDLRRGIIPQFRLLHVTTNRPKCLVA